jgi:hypothetical protein
MSIEYLKLSPPPPSRNRFLLVFFTPSPLLLARVLDEPFSPLTPLSGGVAVQARQSTQVVILSILFSLAGRYDGYSAELA